jgi:formyltetrahydrofolate synthetase
MGLEAFAIAFEKLVQIKENVDIQKEFDIDVMVQGNSALADAKGESSALGPNTHTETLALTTTVVQQGVGSSSSSIAESVAAATRDAKADWHW